MYNSNMKRRKYHQFCALAKAMDVIGERWTLLIIRDLLLGPKRFSDLLNSLSGITTNLLSKRLKEMEEAQLIEKQKTPPPTSVMAYVLTEKGKGLEQVIFALGNWGDQFLLEPELEDTYSICWAMVAVRRKSKKIDKIWIIELSAEDIVFQVKTGQDLYEIIQGSTWQADIRIKGSEKALLQLLSKRQSIQELLTQKAIQVDGSEDALEDFMSGYGNPLR